MTSHRMVDLANSFGSLSEAGDRAIGRREHTSIALWQIRARHYRPLVERNIRQSERRC